MPTFTTRVLLASALALFAAACGNEDAARGGQSLTLEPIPVLRGRVGVALSQQVTAKASSGAITYALEGAPEGMTVSGSGLIAWTPAAGQEGVQFADLKVAVPSASLAAQARLDLVIAPADAPNQAPVVDALVAGTTLLDREETTSLVGLARDPDGDALTFTWTSSDAGWTVTGTGASVTVAAPKAFESSTTITLKVSDGTAEATKTITLATRGNASPIIAPIVATPNPVARGGELVAEAFALDPEGDALTFTWTADGDFTVVGEGAHAIVTAPDVSSAEGTITVEVTDAAGAKASASTVVRTRENRPPVVGSLVALPFLPEPGAEVHLVVDAADPDGDSLDFDWEFPEGWLGTSNDAEADVTAPGEAGVGGVVIVRVDDGEFTTTAKVAVATATAGGTPADPNHPPQIESLQLPVNPIPDPGAGMVFARAYDPDGDELTWEWSLGAPAGGAQLGSWSITGNGPAAQLSYSETTDGGAEAVVVTLKVTDSHGASAERTIVATTGWGYRLTTAIENLASEGLVVSVNGESLPVAQNRQWITGNERFVAGTPYIVTIENQPADQVCHVVDGIGIVGPADTGGTEQMPRVVCPLVQRSTRTSSAAFETASLDYVAIPGLANLSFNVPVATPLLLTLHVPHTHAKAAGDFADAWYAVEVDGQIVAETSWQSAVWGQGGPVSIIAVPNVDEGNHTVRGLLKYGGNGNATKADVAVVLDTLGEVQLTATALESLESYDRSTVAEVIADQSTTNVDYAGVTGLSATLPVGANAPALVALQVPQSLAPDGETTSFRVHTAENDTFAEQHYRHEGSHHAVTLAGLDFGDGGERTWEAEWKRSGTTAPAATTHGTLQLSAVAFKRGTVARSSTLTTGAFESTGNFVDIPGLASVGIAGDRPGKALVVFQASAMHVDGNGPSGLVELTANGVTVAQAHVQSQNSNWSSPVTIATVVDVADGGTDFAVRWKANNPPNALRLDPGVTRLSAILLQ